MEWLVGICIFMPTVSSWATFNRLPRSNKQCLKSQSRDTLESLTLEIVSEISQIEKSAWNRLLDDSSSPFCKHDWINILEQSGCVSVQNGWQPVHLILRNTSESSTQTQVVAACPSYLKYHSMGEFIFDQQWARFAEASLGIRYYPKLLSAIPFTPVAGNRVFVDPSKDTETKKLIEQRMAQYLKVLASGNKLASANVNFMTLEEVDSFVSAGFQHRETIQYRWTNLNKETGMKYINFDDYLSLFKSKRRVQIKKERKSVYEEQGLRVDAIRGDDPRATPELYQRMHDIYATTIEKMWGMQYLSADVFRRLAEAPDDFRKHILFILAYSRDGALVGGTFNVVSGSHFHGRYWGAFDFYKNLHFEACYYRAIEYCIDHGIDYMEPGAGGGEFKFLRGFDPYIVHSVHCFTDGALHAAVATYLAQERAMNEGQAQYLLQNSALGVRRPAGASDDPASGERT